MENDKFYSAKNLAALAMLTALVVVLQVFGSYFTIGAVRLSFVLIPIVVGAIVLGPLGGAFLGFVFGTVTFIMGVVGTDAFTNVLFTAHPFLTALTCFVKATAAGLISGVAYKLLKNKSELGAVFLASALAPILNTALFILGAFCMYDSINSMASAANVSAVYFLFILCAGVNFLIEFALNMVLAPAVCRVVKVVKRV